MRALLPLLVLALGCSSSPDDFSADASAGSPATEHGESGSANDNPRGGSTNVSGTAGAPQQNVAGAGGSVEFGGNAGSPPASIAGSSGGGSTSAAAGTGGSAAGTGGAASSGGQSSEGGASLAGSAGESGSASGGSSAGAGGVGGTANEVCECSSGACCDGCHIRPKSYFCGEVVRSGLCLDEGHIDLDYWNLFCSGDSAGECTRWGAHTKFAGGSCPNSTVCVEQGDQASCKSAN